LGRYAAQSTSPIRHLGGLIITAHAATEKSAVSTDQSSGRTIHGIRYPMQAGLLDPTAFAQSIDTLIASLKLSSEALFR
jgi:hypothetical protein